MRLTSIAAIAMIALTLVLSFAPQAFAWGGGGRGHGGNAVSGTLNSGGGASGAVVGGGGTSGGSAAVATPEPLAGLLVGLGLLGARYLRRR